MRKNSLDIKFDLARPPVRQRWFLRPVTWLISFPVVWSKRLKVHKKDTTGLKPPYLLLCTHMAFVDFMVTTAAIFPHRANYVVAIDGFIGREWLLRNVGGICKRKFTNDLYMIRHIRQVIKNGDVLALYPEARYSQCGTTAVLPDSLGKLVRLLKVPVVMLNMHGNYLSSPCWNLKKRKVRLEADLSQIITAAETTALSVPQINERIRQAFYYDEYHWWQDKKFLITHPDNAAGLHKILYQCPNCLAEQQMDSARTSIWCNNCQKSWTLLPTGFLKADKGETEFAHVPNWYEFLRQQVRSQIEAGTYYVVDEVDVDALPNARGYINLGPGQLVHDMNGFYLTTKGRAGQPAVQLHKSPLSLYSCHIEYDYDQRGDCLDLSTMDDTYYIYPLNLKNVVTKLALATEELYSYHVRQQKEKA